MPKSRKPTRKATAGAIAPNLRDVRLLTALLLAEDEPQSDLEQAQEIMYDAWDARTRSRRIALAKKALAMSPLCADAYVLLAEESAKDLSEKLGLYRRGVEAGEQALGEQAFVEDEGHFWGILETRPYMRARHGLALALWEQGRRDEAVTHLTDMLRLNPNDNQGLRYCLLNRLLELGRDSDCEKLLKRYSRDAATEWLYPRALALFRRRGDCKAARDALAEAVRANPYVPDYLWGGKPMPRTLPDLVAWRSEDEAVSYVHDGRAAWTASASAFAWGAAEANTVSREASPTETQIEDLPRLFRQGKVR